MHTVSLLADLLGVRISLGAVSAVETRVSEAVRPAVDEAWTKLGDAPVEHTDGTGWLQAGMALAVCTIATPCQPPESVTLQPAGTAAELDAFRALLRDANDWALSLPGAPRARALRLPPPNSDR